MKRSAVSAKHHGLDSWHIGTSEKPPAASTLGPVVLLSLLFSLVVNLTFFKLGGGLVGSRGQQVSLQPVHPAAAASELTTAAVVANDNTRTAVVANNNTRTAVVANNSTRTATELATAAVAANNNNNTRTAVVANDNNTRTAATPSQPDPATKWGLFVGVLSAAGNFDARQAIRDTWGADPRLLRVMFFTLRPKSNETFLQLQLEAAERGDLMVVSEVPEDYYNITHSTLALFRAAAAWGPQVKLVLKADDDCFIRVSLLLKALQGAPSSWLYAGFPMKPAPIPRQGKWGIPYSNWASNDSVIYGLGQAGYVLSIDLARLIAAGAPHLVMPPDNMLIIEDMAVGIWVAAMAKTHNATVHHLELYYTPYCDQQAVSSTLKEPRAANMRCTFEHGGDCCRI